MLSAFDWIQLALLGGFFGMIGQVARIAIGMKKRREEAEDTTAFNAVLRPGELRLSLLYGVAAGVVAVIIAVAAQDPKDATTVINVNDVSLKFLLGLVVAGYTGTDILEGFVKSHLKKA